MSSIVDSLSRILSELVGIMTCSKLLRKKGTGAENLTTIALGHSAELG